MKLVYDEKFLESINDTKHQVKYGIGNRAFKRGHFLYIYVGSEYNLLNFYNTDDDKCTKETPWTWDLEKIIDFKTLLIVLLAIRVKYEL